MGLVMNLSLDIDKLGRDRFKDVSNILLILFVSLFYTRTIVFSSNEFIPFGWDFDSNLSSVAYILNGNLSFWNDSWMLGFPDYAGPLSNIFYPVSTLVFIVFGIVSGLKILIFIHVLFSGIGFYLFSQNLTKNNFARLYGSIIYMLSGSLAARIYAGHLEKIMIFPWVPITLYFLYKAIDNGETGKWRNRYIIFSSISASMFVLAGDLYGALYFSFLFFAFFVTKIVYSKDKKIIFTFLKIIAFTILISSLKLIPIIIIKDHLVRSIDIFTGLEDILLVFSRFYSSNSTNVSYGWWESYSFIGILPFILFLAGLLFHKSKEKYYLILSIIIAIVWVQNNSPYLAKEIHSLPIFNNFRVPTRIYLFLTFYVIAISTLGFDFTINKLKEKNISNMNIFIFSAFLILIASSVVYFENYKFLTNEIDQSNMKLYEDTKFQLKSFERQTSTPIWVKFDDPGFLTRQHVFIQKGIHYLNAYYGYNFKTIEYINISNVKYSIPDIYMSINNNSNQSVKKEIIFDLHRYNNSLPFAFIIRGNQIVADNLNVETYQPDDIVINATHVSFNDVIVLKTNWYSGWVVELDDKNGKNLNTSSYQGLLSYKIISPLERMKMHFKFIPYDLYAALLLSSLPILYTLYYLYRIKS